MEDGPKLELVTSYRHGIRYADLGAADSEASFVLLHGLGNSLNFWCLVAPSLAQTCRTIAVDIPGFGRSAVPAGGVTLSAISDSISSLLRDLNVGQATVVAHSLGAIVGLQLAAVSHDLVNRLVLVSGTLEAPARLLAHPLPQTLSHPRLALSTAAQFLGASVPMEHAARYIAYSAWARRVLLREFLADSDAVPPAALEYALMGNSGRHLRAALSEASRLDVRSLRHQVRAPVDLLSGADDRLIPIGDFEAACGAIRPERTRLAPACGHWPLLEAPNEVVEFVLEGHSRDIER